MEKESGRLSLIAIDPRLFPASLETAVANADEWLAMTTRQAVGAFLAGRASVSHE